MRSWAPPQGTDRNGVSHRAGVPVPQGSLTGEWGFSEAFSNHGHTLSPSHPATSLATHVTAFWWQHTEKSGLLAVAVATGGVDPEAKAVAVGQGGDEAVRLAVLGGHAGAVPPGYGVAFRQGWGGLGAAL